MSILDGDPSVFGSPVWTIGHALSPSSCFIRVSNYRKMRARKLENWKIGGRGVDSIEKIDGMEGRVSKEIECLVVYQV